MYDDQTSDRGETTHEEAALSTSRRQRGTRARSLGWNSPDNDLIGMVLDGKYRIEQRLGEGGQSSVYKARHLTLDMPVAIKILKDWNAQDAVSLRRFEREAKRSAQLKHPNIVTVHDFGYHNGLYYIVSEFVEGTDLQKYLKGKGATSLADTVAILGPIADALDYAHRQGVIHRDVKPSNILLDAHNQRAVLCDFGLARRLEDEDLTSTAENRPEPGTPAYMSPEQHRGHEIDQRTDIYSFGLVAYEMLCGKHAFRTLSDTSETIRLKHLQDAPPPPRSLNPALSAATVRALMRALAKDPQDRPATVGAFMHELQETGAPGLPAWAKWLGALAGIGLLAVVVISLAGNPRQSPEPTATPQPAAPVIGLAPTTLPPASPPPKNAPTATGVPATAVPVSPQAPVLKAAPGLVSPSDGARLEGRFVTLSWTGSGELADDEGYLVRLVAPDGHDLEPFFTTQRSLQQELVEYGRYAWSVELVSVVGGRYVTFAASERRAFERPAPPTSTPVPTTKPAPAPAPEVKPATAMPGALTVTVVGLDAEALGCSSLRFFKDGQQVREEPLAAHADGIVQVPLGSASEIEFVGGPEGAKGCPWNRFNLDGAVRRSVQGDGLTLTFAKKPAGGGSKGATAPAWNW